MVVVSTPQGTFGTVYLAEETLTALAEVRGVLHDDTGAVRIANPQPWTLVTIEGVLDAVLDLTRPEIQARLSTSQEELTREWRGVQAQKSIAPTQLLGLAAHRLGSIIAIRYPSAVTPEGHGLAVFAGRLVAGGESF